MSGIRTAAALVALAAALAIAVQCLAYHRPSVAQRAQQTGPSADQLAFQQHQRELAAELDRLDGKYGCMDPDTWTVWRSRIKVYPAHMIVQPVTAAGLPTWGLVVKPWSFSNVGGFVKGLCIK